MTNEYGSNFFNDLRSQNTKDFLKDFELIQNTLNDNYDDRFFYNKKINLCSQQPYQNQVSTPPTSPFLSYEPSSLSCDTSFSSCSSSLSPILTPTTTISPSHSTLNSVSSSLSSSPIKSEFLDNEINENDNTNSALINIEQEPLYEDLPISYEQYNNTINDIALNIEQSHQQLQQL